MIRQTISHYKILEKLGEGGMGVVYKAEDTKLKREVAIKFLPHHISVNEEERKRFEIEAQAAASLNHPNITTIYSVEEVNENVFIVMEFIDGEELKNKIKAKMISVDDAIDIAIKICDGLEAAHKKGIVHRDIKSSNIMVTEDGAVKIMDFGLAKVSGAENLTRLGMTLGTIVYMSPEQTTGTNVDHQTDIWSLGVVLYELFTGVLPFKGDYDQAVVYSILNETPASLRLYNENIPPPLESIVLKALSKNKEDRYQSAAKLLDDLKLLKEKSEASLKGISKQFSFDDKSIKVRKSAAPKFSYPKTILILLLIAVVGFLLYKYIPELNQLFFNSEVSILPEEKHIAVIPFNVIGNKNEDKYLAEGLAEVITSKLSQLEQYKDKLWFVPTSEMLKSKVQNPDDALKAFGINLAITGSLQKLNNRYQLILNLIDPLKKRQISSRIIDEPLTGTSSIQNEAVLETAEMMNIQLEENVRNTLKSGETDNAVANEFYIQGKGNLLHFGNTAELNTAIGLFEKALKEDPGFALAYSGLGEACLRMYSKTKDAFWINKAKENCLKADEISKNLSPVHITLGLLYNETGKYEEANKEFLIAQNIDPSNIDAYTGQATAYNKQGKLDEAESIYKKVIKMKPDYWAGYNHLGVFYYLQGKYKEAAQQFEQMLKLTPLNAGAYRNLGAMYYYQDQKADAIVMFKRSLEIEPDYSVYSNLATLYYYEGLYKDAASMYEQALKLQDTDYSVWGYLAGAYRQSSADSSKIIFVLRKAKLQAERQLKINPVDPEVLTNIASYCTELNLPDSALTIVKKVESLNPKDVNVMILIGEVYEQLGKRDQAITWINKAIDNGYSIEELDHIPELKNLRADSRFEKIISKLK
ncbi:MAG: hypothetical protein A2V93_12785 [Ignavibacteria bacterium RBG_16_34_14]|nr:MAG: hypothetical protein A2V93_12785 [Ignavibacteria bacterium RBG_16_34_14]